LNAQEAKQEFSYNYRGAAGNCEYEKDPQHPPVGFHIPFLFPAIPKILQAHTKTRANMTDMLPKS
jgi:hypothetical protein